MQPAAVSAPGKVILMGEHAVVYGRPALVAAVDLRLTARLVPLAAAPGKDTLEIHLPELGVHRRSRWRDVLARAGVARERWQRYAERPSPERFAALAGGEPGHAVEIALGEAARFLGEDAGPPLELTVTSQLPIGSGFGSSAALAVAVVAGYLAAREVAVEPGEIEALALEAERRQHGFPSGVDGATVLYGGLIWAERRGDGPLVFTPLEEAAAASPLLASFAVFDTGTPAETTGTVVAAVRQRREAQPERYESVLDAMGETTRAFRRLLLAGGGGDSGRLIELVRRFEAGLEELGVVPEPVAGLIRRVEAAGGAAKISGAGALTARSSGLPGAGSLLVTHPEPERIAEWSFLAPLPRHRVTLGAQGLRREPS